jgi:hypothetical protein
MGRSSSVPTSRNAWVLGEAAASQMVTLNGTIIGHRLMASPM